jgi:hypothetical protein
MALFPWVEEKLLALGGKRYSVRMSSATPVWQVRVLGTADNVPRISHEVRGFFYGILERRYAIQHKPNTLSLLSALFGISSAKRSSFSNGPSPLSSPLEECAQSIAKHQET